MATTFAELLRREMEKRLHTQERAAEVCGVSVKSIKRYLAGGRPQYYNAVLIAEAYQLDMSAVAEAIAATRAHADGNGGTGEAPALRHG